MKETLGNTAPAIKSAQGRPSSLSNDIYSIAKERITKAIFGETLESKLFNFDNPIAYITIHGIMYRIAEGFIVNKKKTYILYKHKTPMGVFSSVEEAQNHVKEHIEAIYTLFNL